MSHLLDQLRFFNRKQGEFADGHGETRIESRDWENVYRSRWQYDKIVRSGKPSRPTTRAPATTCPTTSRAAARVAPATAGTFTAPTA